MEVPRQTLIQSTGLLILRLGMGGYMATHGWGKLQMLLAGNYEMFGDPIGIGSQLSLSLITFAEFVCAILVMLGMGTRFAAATLVIGMTVAAFVAHASDPWTSGEAFRLFTAGETKFPVSKEMALLYLVPFRALVFTGAGQFSIDRWIGRRTGKHIPAKAT